MILNVNTLAVTWKVFSLSQPSGPGVLCAHMVAVGAAITACNKTNCSAVTKVYIIVVKDLLLFFFFWELTEYIVGLVHLTFH